MHPKQLTHACQTPHKLVAMLGFVGWKMKFIFILKRKKEALKRRREERGGRWETAKVHLQVPGATSIREDPHKSNLAGTLSKQTEVAEV